MYRITKRFFDFLFSSIGIFLMLPIFIPIMILLKLTGEGEIFYKQERVGYKNKLFGIMKFATMLKNSLNMGSKTITVRNDPRITPIGKWLRITKLNELPQLINVIKGEMSLVGPRPLLSSSFDKYDPEVQVVIYKKKPGITGIGSLVFRDEERLVTAVKNNGMDPMDYYRKFIYPYKGALELWYHDNISFKIDVTILILTVWAVIHRDSDLVFKVIKNLPPKPHELSIDWIEKSYR